MNKEIASVQKEFADIATKAFGESRISIEYSDDVEGVKYENLSLWIPESFTKPKMILIEPFTCEFKPGTRATLSGPSGCGKSTILRAQKNMHIDGCGKIIFNSKLKNIDNEHYPSIVIAQRANMPLTDLKGILTYPYVDSSAFADDLVIDALRKVGMAETLASDEAKLREKLHDKSLDGNHYLNTLSGGQQQRLMFARAIILNPRFIALDEATSALDKESGPEMYKVLIENLRPDVIMLSVAHRDDIKPAHNVSAEITKDRKFIVRPMSEVLEQIECPALPCPVHCPR